MDLNTNRTVRVWNKTNLQPNCMSLHYRKALFFNKSLQNSLCLTITLMFLYYSEMPKPQINLISGFTVNVLCSLRSSDDHSGLYQPFIPNDRFLWRAQFCKARTCSWMWSPTAFLENHWSVRSSASGRGPTSTQLCNRGQQRAVQPQPTMVWKS